MKIAICDDTLEELKNSKEILIEYFRSRKIVAQIDTYSSAEVLINKLTYFDKSEYSIFFLDIIMPVSGLILAKKIKSIYENAIIIFTTTSKEFAVDAFSIRAFSYFVKPLNKEEVFAQLDELMKNIYNKEKVIISVKTNDLLVVSININDICYIESDGRRLVYHLSDNSKIITTSIRKKFLESIPFDYNKYNFLNCHSSYIVNMEYIKSIGNLSFTMSNGESISISKRNYSMAKERYFKYLTGE